MPTILQILGWRLFFYSNEGKEPPHVHASKGNAECKYWLLPHEYDIEESHAYGLTPKDKREIRKIIFDHFDYILEQWRKMQEQR